MCRENHGLYVLAVQQATARIASNVGEPAVATDYCTTAHEEMTDQRGVGNGADATRKAVQLRTDYNRASDISAVCAEAVHGIWTWGRQRKYATLSPADSLFDP